MTANGFSHVDQSSSSALNGVFADGEAGAPLPPAREAEREPAWVPGPTARVGNEGEIACELYGDICASLLTFIAMSLGEEAVNEAWRHVADDLWRPLLSFFKQQNDLPGLACVLGVILRANAVDFQVVEDSEKWCFEFDGSTVGGRMILAGKVRNCQGAADGHHRFGATARAYPWSLEQRNFPYYDVRDVLWLKVLPSEWGWDVLDIEYLPATPRSAQRIRYLLFKQPRSPVNYAHQPLAKAHL